MTMGDDDPQGIANLDPRGIIGRIYVEHHNYYILNIKAIGLVFSEKKISTCSSHYKNMLDNFASGRRPFAPGS